MGNEQTKFVETTVQDNGSGTTKVSVAPHSPPSHNPSELVLTAAAAAAAATAAADDMSSSFNNQKNDMESNGLSSSSSFPTSSQQLSIKEAITCVPGGLSLGTALFSSHAPAFEFAADDPTLYNNNNDNDDSKEMEDGDTTTTRGTRRSSGWSCSPTHQLWRSLSSMSSSRASSSSSSTTSSSSSTTTTTTGVASLSLPWRLGLLPSKSELLYTAEELALSDTIPSPASDLGLPRLDEIPKEGYNRSGNNVYARKIKPIWLVTTAALPWMTGTAVNPLLRAAYLWQRQMQCLADPTAVRVHLVIPWLELPQDRVALYGDDWQDATPQQQEAFIRNWLAESAFMPEAAHHLQLHFYPARYHPQLSSIFAMGDICELLGNDDNDNENDNENDNDENSDNRNAVCILEEPEHLNYYRAPGQSSWRRKFGYVTGIVHTNYQAYARQHAAGLFAAPVVSAVSAWLVRAYCDKVIKLSHVLQEYAPEKELVCNVHGIRQEFFHVPPPLATEETTLEEQLPGSGDTGKVYFIGKLLWAKGLDKLLHLQAVFRRKTGDYFAMDIFGTGPDEEEIQRAYLGGMLQEESSSAEMDLTATTSTTKGSSSSSSDSDEENEEDEQQQQQQQQEQQSPQKNGFPRTASWSALMRNPLPVRFRGRLDHAKVGPEYKIFVNPSKSEVLCTTTAEALAMGKFVIIPRHPSNTFFEAFPNCLFYSDSTEFVQQMQFALQNMPQPLSDQSRHALTWEAATDRFIQAAVMSERDAARCERVSRKSDERIAQFHYEWFSGRTGDVLRKVLWAGPVAEQSQYGQTSASPEKDVSPSRK